MAGFSWLAIANSFDGAYTRLPSILYRWHAPAAAFVERQRFLGDGARQWKHFSCGAGQIRTDAALLLLRSRGASSPRGRG